MENKLLTAGYDWFYSYIQRFASTDKDIQQHMDLKELHTYYVVENGFALAQNLGLNKADARLAELVCLYHDIGRFKQYTVYRTFKDRESEDHAALGLRELETAPFLNHLSPHELDAFRFAIACHNAVSIPDHGDERQKLFARIIRDADKLDIFRVLASPLACPPTGQALSPVIIDSVINGKQACYTNIRHLDDRKLIQLCWLYDINYSWTFRQIVNRGFIDHVFKYLPDTADIRLARNRVSEYVQKRLQQA